MAWISTAAARANMAANIASVLELRRNTGVTRLMDADLVAAWVGGDVASVAEEEDIFLHLHALNPRVVRSPPSYQLGTVAASLLLRRCEGADVDSELQALAEAKGHKDWLPRAVQRSVARILAGAPATGRPRKIGCPERPKAFYDLAERAAPPVPALVALVPDHPLYPHVSMTVVPLAYESLVAAGEVPTRASLRACVASGADLRARDVVYARHEAGRLGAYREDPAEVSGFDAVELVDGVVVVHHYMGARWQAPLLVDEDLDAFRFIAHVSAGWEIVRRTVSKDAWARIEAARASREIHRVSIDPVNSVEDPASTERARQRYGVEIEVVSLFTA